MTKDEVAAAARVSAVDELGALQKELAPYKAKIARADALAKVIRSWFEDADASVGHTALGEAFQAALGPKSMKTLLAPMQDIAKALGRKKFMLAVNMTVKALEQHASPVAFLALTSQEQTGSRDLLVTERAKAEEQAA